MIPGDTYPEAPKVTAEEGWVFTGWEPEYTLTGKVGNEIKTETKTYTAQYKEDENGDGTPDEDQTLTIQFADGAHGKVDGTATYTVIPGDTYPEAPKVTAEEGWVFTGWEPEYTLTGKVGNEIKTETKTYTAQYKEDENGDGTPDEDQTLTIQFADGAHGKVDGTATYTVIPGDTYPKAPLVTAEEGWVFTGWAPSYELTGKVGKIEKSETKTYTAQYKEDENGDGTPDEDQTLTIQFADGAHGKVDGTATYTVIPGDTYPKAPLVTAEEGWVFTGWAPSYELTGKVGKIEKSETKTYTAQYKEDENGDGTPDEDQTLTIQFADGEHGKIDGTATYTVIPGDTYPEAPSVTAEEGWVFTGWEPAYELKGTVGDEIKTETKTYTAQFIREDGEGETPETPTDPSDPSNGGNTGNGGSTGNAGNDGNTGNTEAVDNAGTQTPTVPAVNRTVVINDNQVPLGDYTLNEVERDGGETEGSVDEQNPTETIDQDATPLGNMDVENEKEDAKTCILHYIILLLAIIVGVIYIIDRKRRKERIEELRKELKSIADQKVRE